MKLLLIRHAESQGNAELRLQGRREFPLTQRGLVQAKSLAARLGPMRPAAVYSSPISRAMHTAELIAQEAGLEVTVEPRVQEYDFGEMLSGLTWPEIKEKSPEVVAALMNNKSEFPPYPGEEGRDGFRERVCSAMREIAVRHGADQVVAIVTHAGPIIVFLLEVLGRAYSRPIPFAIDNGSVTTVESARQTVPRMPEMVVSGLNDGCHLRRIRSDDRGGDA